MKINVAKEMTRVNIEQQIKGEYFQPIIWAGNVGIGKSRTLEKLAKDLNLAYIDYSLPTMSTEILSGLPQFVNAEDLSKYNLTGDTAIATEWSAPLMIMEANRLANEKDGCVLVLEDIHETNMSVMPYFYALLEERRLGSFKLDDKVAIVGTMNISEEANFNGIASPIKDRCSILKVDFDFDTWYENIGKSLNHLVSSFIKLNPHFLEEEETTDLEQFLTPRSATYLGRELNHYSFDFILKNAYDIAATKMSRIAAKEFKKHVEYIAKIDFSKLMKQRKIIDISKKKIQDAIVYAFIINYVETIEDAKYVAKLIDANIEESLFVGFLVGELYNKYQLAESGKPITQGQQALIDIVVKTDSEIQLKNRDKFIDYAMEFL